MKTLRIIFIAIVAKSIIGCKEPSKEYKKELEPYVSFIKKEQTSAKDYILRLFEDHNIVIIAERLHPELTQYELVLELANDPWFIENIGHIFIEVCSRTQESNVQEYLLFDALTEQKADSLLLHINRNNSVHPLWGNYNFKYFFEGIRAINERLDATNKLNIYPSDVAINWPEMTSEKYEQFWDKTIIKRDSLMADYTIKKFDSISLKTKRKKALVIQNYRHAFGHDFTYEGGEKSNNVGRFLFEAYPGRVANVLLNTVTWDDDDNYTPVVNGKWDAAFKVTHKDDLGFDFKNSPFGDDYFDLWPWEEHEFIYSNVYNGYVQYKHVEDFKIVNGIENLIDSTFLQEVRRRKELVNIARETNGIISDSMIWNYNNVRVSPISGPINVNINKWIK